MEGFGWWYAYFDSIFLKKNPTLPEDFQPPNCDQKYFWPAYTHSNELVECFRDLEEFIHKQQNWGESICTIEELNKVESDLSYVLNFMRIEKIYIAKFWNEPRRIEASLTHLYAIFQIFIRSFIPYETMTIFECKAAKKLCISLTNLQALVNVILKKVSSISEYFRKKEFEEERKIIANFFQNFVAFIRNIPKIKKYRMFHVSELLKYIVIINPIEIQKLKIKKQILVFPQQKREKSAKVTDSRKVKSLDIKNEHLLAFMKYDRLGKRKYRRKSCEEFIKKDKKQNRRKKSETMMNKFAFPNWIRRYSINHRRQTLRKISVEKNQKIGKGKSSTQVMIQSPSKSKEKLKPKTKTNEHIALKKQNTLPNPDMVSSPTKFKNRKSTVGMIYASLQQVNKEEERFQSEVSPLITKQNTQLGLQMRQNPDRKLCLSTMSILKEDKSNSEDEIKDMISAFILEPEVGSSRLKLADSDEERKD